MDLWGALIDSRDGTEYQTILISGEWGTQCWMAENLNIGTMIDGSMEQSNNGTIEIIEKYCYEDSPSNCDVYGGLYQWNEMMQYNTSECIQGICPNGWHIPTHWEWCILPVNVGGFTGLPAGDRTYLGWFYGLYSLTSFWSSSLYNSNEAWSMGLSSDNPGVSFYNSSMNWVTQ